MKNADGGAPAAKPVAGPCPNAVATRMSPFGFSGVMAGASVTVDTPVASLESPTSACASTSEDAAPAISNSTIVVFELAVVSGIVTPSVELVTAFSAYWIAGVPVLVWACLHAFPLLSKIGDVVEP